MSGSEHWIVVGAGSAGCVLANRLSASPDRRVTLVDDGPPLSPGEVPRSLAGPSFLEALAEPGRTHGTLLARRTPMSEPSLYRRGRGIGGSSAVNAMVALRGSAERYEAWGWDDTDDHWDQIRIPTESAPHDELGSVDRALLSADDRTAVAELTRRDGRRVTSAEAYLWPALGRSNLRVLPNAEVSTISIEGRLATGVQFADGTSMSADRVVLSAGAIHTPTLLLRSGVDTPGVGVGLQDHPSAVFTLRLRDGVVQQQQGLALGSHLHVGIGSDLIQFLPLSVVGTGADTVGLGALLVALMTPSGRHGSVTLDDRGDPHVDFALLEDLRDLDALIAGVRLGLDLLDRSAFADIVDEVFIDDVGTPSSTLVDDDAIAGWLRRRCGDYVHASSSCPMGTVVDEGGWVIGYDGLAVCDASIFPSIPDANTHLPTTMLAERMCLPGRLLPQPTG